MARNVAFLSELLILTLIFYQDLKYRAVNWLLFLGLAILGFTMSLLAIGFKNTLLNAMFNNVVVLLELSLVYLYFLIKMRRGIKFINEKLGIGDVMMLFALSFSFSPVNFMVFVLLSLIISLSIALIWKEGPTIPLAGYMGLCYLIFLTLNHFVLNYDVYMGSIRIQ